MNARLQRLREVLRLEWGELASHLGVSRSMLDFVRKGQRNLSFPALRRLEEAERAAGILPPTPSVPAPETVPPGELSSPLKNLKVSGRKSDHAAEIRAILAEVDSIKARLERLLND